MYGLIKIANERIIKDYSFFEKAMERGEPIALDNLTNEEGIAFSQALMDRANRMGVSPSPKQLKLQSAVAKGQKFLTNKPHERVFKNAGQFIKKHPLGVAASGVGAAGAGLAGLSLAAHNQFNRD